MVFLKEKAITHNNQIIKQSILRGFCLVEFAFLVVPKHQRSLSNHIILNQILGQKRNILLFSICSLNVNCSFRFIPFQRKGNRSHCTSSCAQFQNLKMLFFNHIQIYLTTSDQIIGSYFFGFPYPITSGINITLTLNQMLNNWGWGYLKDSQIFKAICCQTVIQMKLMLLFKQLILLLGLSIRQPALQQYRSHFSPVSLPSILLLHLFLHIQIPKIQFHFIFIYALSNQPSRLPNRSLLFLIMIILLTLRLLNRLNPNICSILKIYSNLYESEEELNIEYCFAENKQKEQLNALKDACEYEKEGLKMKWLGLKVIVDAQYILVLK